MLTALTIYEYELSRSWLPTSGSSLSLLKRLFVCWSTEVSSREVVISAGPLLSVFFYRLFVGSKRVSLELEWLFSRRKWKHAFSSGRLERLLDFKRGLEVHPVLCGVAKLCLHE